MNWQSYEETVRNIYEILGKEHGVKIEGWGASCKVKGKSDVEHQIDVLTRHSDGVHDYRTAIEAKYWNKKVTKDTVAKVADIVEDAQLSKGVIVSKRGFTPDCIDFAKYRNISLVELREISDEDWAGKIRYLHLRINAVYPDIAALQHIIPSDYDGPQIKGESLKATDVIYEFPDNSKQTAQDIIQGKLAECDWTKREKTLINVPFEPGTRVSVPENDNTFPCNGISFAVVRRQQLCSESVYDGGEHVAMIMKSVFEELDCLIMKDGTIRKNPAN